jgi:hypothetical protein
MHTFFNALLTPINFFHLWQLSLSSIQKCKVCYQEQVVKHGLTKQHAHIKLMHWHRTNTLWEIVFSILANI